MANVGLVKKIMSLSPHIEMMVRRLYWLNVKKLAGRVAVKPKQKNKGSTFTSYKFDELEVFLQKQGVANGSLLVVHSAFSSFKGRVEGPDEIIDKLLEYIGASGTLAMPAMPVFKNARPLENYLSAAKDVDIYEYDVNKSRIKTGVLPSILHKRGALRSRHPINTMVALGPLAGDIMEGNISGESPLACGANSSWKHCVDNDAIIIGLGTDLTHSLTMIHVAEDVLDSAWPIKDWYIEKNFQIKDGDFEEIRVLRERAPKWGALHFGERTLCKELLAEGILKSKNIDGILIETLNAKELMRFLNDRNGFGYPYFWVNK